MVTLQISDLAAFLKNLSTRAECHNKFERTKRRDIMYMYLWPNKGKYVIEGPETPSLSDALLAAYRVDPSRNDKALSMDVTQ